jgi:hypothetical protein
MEAEEIEALKKVAGQNRESRNEKEKESRATVTARPGRSDRPL